MGEFKEFSCHFCGNYYDYEDEFSHSLCKNYYEFVMDCQKENIRKKLIILLHYRQ